MHLKGPVGDSKWQRLCRRFVGGMETCRQTAGLVTCARAATSGAPLVTRHAQRRLMVRDLATANIEKPGRLMEG